MSDKWKIVVNGEMGLMINRRLLWSSVWGESGVKSLFHLFSGFVMHESLGPNRSYSRVTPGLPNPGISDRF